MVFVSHSLLDIVERNMTLRGNTIEIYTEIEIYLNQKCLYSEIDSFVFLSFLLESLECNTSLNGPILPEKIQNFLIQLKEEGI